MWMKGEEERRRRRKFKGEKGEGSIGPWAGRCRFGNRIAIAPSLYVCPVLLLVTTSYRVGPTANFKRRRVHNGYFGKERAAQWQVVVTCHSEIS